MNIATKAQIETEAEKFQEYLELEVSEDIAEVEDRGSTLTVIMARSGKLLADAKAHKDRAMKESILNRMNNGLNASTLNKLIDADCEDENYLVNWMERINRGCTHQMDWCRTLISKAKEEMRFQGYNS